MWTDASITQAISAPRGAAADPLSVAPPPLLDGESEADYRAFLEAVAACVGPHDVIEAIHVRDVVDVTWEILRWRRLKQGIVRAGRAEAVDTLLPTGMIDFAERAKLVDGYMEGEEVAAAYIQARREALCVTDEDLTARAYAARMNDLERVDRLIGQAEARRRLLLNDVDRRRDAFARRLREGANAADASLLEPAK